MKPLSNPHPSRLQRQLSGALLAITVGLASPLASASGSVGFESGPGTPVGGYNQGKRVAAKKLLCSSCPLAGQKLDAALAQRISSEPALTASLSAEDKSALASYLSRRFPR